MIDTQQQYIKLNIRGEISIIAGGNRSTRRKPPPCLKSLTNFITVCCAEYLKQLYVIKLVSDLREVGGLSGFLHLN
jgi:hypothetical protein